MSSATDLHIPAVTVEHIAAFHLAHFGTHAPSASFPATSVDRKTEILEPDGHRVEEEQDDGDDGLGYYPDGNKRTLTNDQIAMFRHSEIARVLRAREIALEHAAFTEGEPDVGDTERGSAAGDAPSTGSVNDHDGEAIDDVSGECQDDEEEKESWASSEQGKQNSLQNTHTNVSKTLGFASSAIKRKLPEAAEDDFDRPTKTKRAHIRSLDAAASESQSLDYDDDSKEKGVPVATAPGGVPAKAAGRSIWWPTLTKA